MTAVDIERINAAFPDLEGETTRSLSEGPKVSFLYTLRGTHVGNGTIIEYRVVFDNLGILERLGVIEK